MSPSSGGNIPADPMPNVRTFDPSGAHREESGTITSAPVPAAPAPEATREADAAQFVRATRDALRAMGFTEAEVERATAPVEGFVAAERDAEIDQLRATVAAQARENETLTGALQGLRHVADRIDELAQKPTFTAYRLHLDGLTRTIRRAAALAARAPEGT